MDERRPGYDDRQNRVERQRQQVLAALGGVLHSVLKREYLRRYIEIIYINPVGTREGLSCETGL